MQSQQKIEQLKEEIEKLTGFIADFGTKEQFEKSEVTFANDVIDALSWVLNEISTEAFQNDAYLNIASLRQMAREIEQQTGNKLNDYE